MFSSSTHLPCAARSQGVPEPAQALDDLPTSIRPTVRAVELQAQDAHDDDDQAAGDDCRIHAGSVAGFVLLAEDGRADDAADAAGADEGRGRESAFPLAADVVRLVSEDGGNLRNEMQWSAC
nr:hypothetical protein CFP56_00287 [Quercus suber]